MGCTSSTSADVAMATGKASQSPEIDAPKQSPTADASPVKAAQVKFPISGSPSPKASGIPKHVDTSAPGSAGRLTSVGSKSIINDTTTGTPLQRAEDIEIESNISGDSSPLIFHHGSALSTDGNSINSEQKWDSESKPLSPGTPKAVITRRICSPSAKVAYAVDSQGKISLPTSLIFNVVL